MSRDSKALNEKNLFRGQILDSGEQKEIVVLSELKYSKRKRVPRRIRLIRKRSEKWKDNVAQFSQRKNKNSLSRSRSAESGFTYLHRRYKENRKQGQICVRS